MAIIKIPLGEVALNDKELTELWDDVKFLEDAILMLLNREVATKSDIPFPHNLYIKFLHEYFMKENNNWSKDFIKKVFNPYNEIINSEELKTTI